jgi:K+ transporter
MDVERSPRLVPMTLAMMRDNWWWPWWVSTLIDLGVVAIAVTVFLMSSRRIVRLIAVAFVLAGLVAAVMAPIVMTEDSDEPMMEQMQPDEAPTMRP